MYFSKRQVIHSTVYFMFYLCTWPTQIMCQNQIWGYIYRLLVQSTTYNNTQFHALNRIRDCAAAASKKKDTKKLLAERRAMWSVWIGKRRYLAHNIGIALYGILCVSIWIFLSPGAYHWFQWRFMYVCVCVLALSCLLCFFGFDTCVGVTRVRRAEWVIIRLLYTMLRKSFRLSRYIQVYTFRICWNFNRISFIKYKRLFHKLAAN